MKAAAIHKPNDIRAKQLDDSVLVNPADATIKATATAIFGYGLHIYDGFFLQHPGEQKT